ncbi:MAG: hypothetical protein KUL82_11945 [Bdellovibrio sp.]|nr:hypothetical protein [Bdellovibrio sp.]
MLSRVKKTQFTSRLETAGGLNNRGQAMVEYVLMLIISVSLVLALMTQVFKPFGEFVNNYMGKYVGCLLEYGELPSLGSSEPSAADEDSECDKKFDPASMAGGRPPTSTGQNGDGTGQSNSQKSSSGDSGGGSSGGSSSSSYAGSASRGGGRNMMSRRRPSTGIEGGDQAGSGKVVEIALDNGGNGGFFRASNGARYLGQGRKTSSVAISGLTDAERKKLEKKAEGSGRVLVTGESLTPPPKKTTVKKPEPKAEVKEDEPLTVGNFIRYLFIAALVIALVIFIGGQALQMSKSFEK